MNQIRYMKKNMYNIHFHTNNALNSLNFIHAKSNFFTGFVRFTLLYCTLLVGISIENNILILDVQLKTQYRAK